MKMNKPILLGGLLFPLLLAGCSGTVGQVSRDLLKNIQPGNSNQWGQTRMALT